ncbi:E3 ubiquitin-protein ligase SH3RF2 [Arvicola amphibius]|uniref:E3 ubiquitin-protein ligase SH3RF2 n=1 Tax=Arvicola amphibius TaxID=1047088 RepID=UPI001C08F858|nr:E3 ubiquitin-protein ligase SH3RF2 [Arvicola amphibius]
MAKEMARLRGGVEEGVVASIRMAPMFDTDIEWLGSGIRRCSLAQSHPGGTDLEGKGSWRAAKFRLCERSGEAIREGATSVAVKDPRWKGPCREAEAWHREESSGEGIGESTAQAAFRMGTEWDGTGEAHGPAGSQLTACHTLRTQPRTLPGPAIRHLLPVTLPQAANQRDGRVSTSQPAPASPGHCTAMVSVPSSQQQLSTNMFVALHAYSAHGPEELDLQKGEGIKVLGKYQDGWLRGLSLVTGRAGIFPSDYVIPVFSSTARKTSSFPDPRSPTVYTTWTLPTSSVSSQGSFSEGDPRQNRPFKSVFVPTTMVNPAGSTAGPGTPGQGSLRKGRSSMRKNGSLQRPVQSGIPTFVVGSLRRSPTMVIRPQKFQFYQPQGMTSSPAPMMVEMGSKPISTGEPALTCSSRGGKTRIHSATGSLITEGKEIPIKSEPPPKPPASAPPSILVKPENSKNGTEKQVKTVRFQNYSPPPTKHYTSHPTSGKHEQPATLKGSQPEAVPSGAEMTVLFAHRSGCHSGQQTDLRRKSAFGKTMPPVATASASQIVLTSK